LKILLIHRYFWPDTPPYAVILKKIARRLTTEGHDVTVLSTQPAYKPELKNQTLPSVELIDGYRVVRLSLFKMSFMPSAVISALNIVAFCVRVMWFGLFNRGYSVVMTSTSPPVLAGVSARAVAKLSRAKLFYHCMDIHPEIGRLSGEFSNPLIFRLLQSLDDSTCRAAERVLVLSNDMRNAIIKRTGIDRGNIEIVQNFNLNDPLVVEATCPVEFAKEDGCFRLIFAGNIGRYQGLESIVDSFMEAAVSNAELVFLGEGKLKAALQTKAAEQGCDRIRFFPHQPIEIANEIIRTADVGIVSLSESVYQYAYPTKVISYLSVACPLMVMIEPESDMANFVSDNQIGICIDIRNTEMLAEGIVKLTSNQQAVDQYKFNATNVYNNYYNEEFVLNRWLELFSGIR